MFYSLFSLFTYHCISLPQPTYDILHIPDNFLNNRSQDIKDMLFNLLIKSRRQAPLNLRT